MRAERLLTIVLLLQVRGRLTAQDLAEELGVSERTIYRDLEALGMAGIAVYGDRGPGGGYGLVDGYRTSLTGLTQTEASSLFLSALPQPLADLGLDKALRDALLKLMAALPSSKREHIEQERALVYLDPASWFQRSEPVPYLSLLQYAAREQRQVKIIYNYPDGHQEERTISPYGLVAKTSLWYVVAHTPRGMRIYKVARIGEAELLDTHFERPADFDLIAHWEQQRGSFEKNLQRYEIQLSIAPYMGDVFQRIYGEWADAILNTAPPPDERGWRTVTLTFENIRQAGSEVLMLGADVEVVAPPELRDYVADIAQKIANRYMVEKMPMLE